MSSYSQDGGMREYSGEEFRRSALPKFAGFGVVAGAGGGSMKKGIGMCTACGVGVIDQAKSDAFAESMVGIFNGAAIALMISVGHRTGLFDAMDEAGWVTSVELGARAGLNERYVREWLGAMTTGRIVEHDGERMVYRLPSEHACWLTRRSAPNNIAVVARYIPTLGQVEDKIVECFRNGGGVGYEHYPSFHEVMAEDSAQSVVAALHDHILPLVGGLVERMTSGVRVLDVGCGRGRALIEMARAFSNSEFVGRDFSVEAIEWARGEAARLGLRNIRFEVADGAAMTDEEAFDAVFTFDAIHDQADPDAVLRNIHRALKPGGVYLMQDIAGSSSHAGDMDRPFAPFIYTVSCMHCMAVSLAAGGKGLGAAWGERLAVEMLQKAGFGSVEVRSLDHDFQNTYYIMQK